MAGSRISVSRSVTCKSDVNPMGNAGGQSGEYADPGKPGGADGRAGRWVGSHASIQPSTPFVPSRTVPDHALCHSFHTLILQSFHHPLVPSPTPPAHPITSSPGSFTPRHHHPHTYMPKRGENKQNISKPTKPYRILPDNTEITPTIQIIRKTHTAFT